MANKQVRKIRLLHSNGERQYLLAKKYGVSKGVISGIVNNKTYVNV